VILLIVLAVAGILLMDTIVKAVVESRIRSETGMDVKIGKFSVGLASPTVLIEDFKLYNTAEFGGSPFIQMPELFLEYDRSQFKNRKLRIKLLRLNLSEIGIVTDKKGHSNIEALGALASKQAQQKMDVEFKGIDTLNLTFQSVRMTQMGDPPQEELLDFKIKNAIFHNLNKEEDFQGLAMGLALKAQGSRMLQKLINPEVNTPAR
jgi:hypothetical protein